MPTKKPWQSKTHWVSLLIAVAAFFPGVSEFIAQNPDAFAVGVSLIFSALRQITKDKISIS